MLTCLLRFLSLSTALREQLMAVPRQDSENELQSTGTNAAPEPDIGPRFCPVLSVPSQNKHVGYRKEVISSLALCE